MKPLAIALILCLAAAMGFADWMGAFRSMKAEERLEGPWVLTGLEKTGSFQAIGLAFHEVQDKAVGLSLSSRARYGIFHDNPNTVAKDKLRWEAGLLHDTLSRAERRALAKAGLKVSDWPSQRVLAIEFPRRNVLSYALGAAKAYPALDRALAGRKPAGAALEIYEPDHVLYLMPLAKAGAKP